MRRTLLWLVALVGLLPFALRAQHVTGNWFGTLTAGQQSARFVLQLGREGDGRLTAALFNLDQGGFGSPSVAYSATIDGNVFKASFARGAFTGVIEPTGTAIKGTWDGSSARAAVPPQPLAFTRTPPSSAWRDSSSHHVRFISVERNVRLEVLDWGGSGRPVVLLTGAGNNAHVFDTFAPKLTDRYHVYAITRRGFPPSSIPRSGYLADSLADDVLAVLDSLRIANPVLIGHSIAGQELSSIGSRRPDRIAGLVYLEAGYPYALYDPTQDNTSIVIPDVQRKLAIIFDRWAPISFAERAAMIRELTDSTLPVLTRDLRLWEKSLSKAPNANVRPIGLRRDSVASAIFNGSQKYTGVKGPVLAIYAAPRPLPAAIASDSLASAKEDSAGLAAVMPQIEAFQRAIPQARVVRLAHATHYVFQSKESDVLLELRAFIDSLLKTP
jgi:non-heme chloroperoxidase